jgi:hypothetical protein
MGLPRPKPMRRRAHFSHLPILESSLDPSMLQPQQNWVAHVDHSPGQCECGNTLEVILSEQPREHQSGPRLAATTAAAPEAAHEPVCVPSVQGYPATPQSALERSRSSNDSDRLFHLLLQRPVGWHASMRSSDRVGQHYRDACRGKRNTPARYTVDCRVNNPVGRTSGVSVHQDILSSSVHEFA